MRVVIFLLCFHLRALFIKFPGGDCAVSFVQRPDDPTVVVLGSNSTNVSLHWECSLGGKQLLLIQIMRYHPADPGTSTQLGFRSAGGSNTISTANFDGRGIMSGTGCGVALLIFNVNVEDGKYKYRGQVIATDETKNDDIDLLVYVRPVIDHPSNTPESISKTEGSSITLFCNATGQPPPTIQWQKISGAPLQFPDCETLTINRTAPEHNGTYQCTATNLAGSSLEKPLFDVVIYYKPRNATISSTGDSDGKVVEGNSVTLTCQAFGGNPDVYSYKWQRNGVNIPGGEDGSLKLITVSRNQAGNYTCITNNSVAGDVNATKSLTVRYKPANASLTLQQGSSKVKWNTEVTLNCNLDDSGNPQVDNYTFYCNSQMSSVVHSNKYTFAVKENVNCSCEGSNSVGGSGKSNIVQVEVYDPPKVNLSDTTTVIEGYNVTLTCNVTGIPQPKVTWSRVLSNMNSSEIISPGPCSSSLCQKTEVKQRRSGELFRVEDVLTLVSVSNSVEGFYTCNASSVEGSDNETIYIDVKDDPCKNVTCENGGICLVVLPTVSSRCSCIKPWKGDTCTETLCTPNPCNGGECHLVDDGSNFKCNCTTLDVGRRCEVKKGNTTQLKAQVKLPNVSYKSTYNDISSSESQKLAEPIETELVNETGAVDAEVVGFKPGSVIVQFILYFKKDKTDEEMEKLLKDALEDGKIGGFQVDPKSLKLLEQGSTTTSPPSKQGSTTTSPSPSDETVIIIIVVVVVVVLLIIIGLIIWKVKKKRCRKDRKVSNGGDVKLDVRKMSEPGPTGYNNPGLDLDYMDKGPTASKPRNNKSKKPEALYAQVDKSKKSQKKKPGELLYADLAAFQPQTGPQADSAEQAVKKPEKHQIADYASITDIMQERDGKSVKVSIKGTDAAQPERPAEEEKPAQDAGDVPKETPEAEKGNPGSEGGDESSNLLSGKEEGDNSKV